VRPNLAYSGQGATRLARRLHEQALRACSFSRLLSSLRTHGAVDSVQPLGRVTNHLGVSTHEVSSLENKLTRTFERAYRERKLGSR